MIKQVIVVRSDLGMRKGKMISQGAHASMKVFFDRMHFDGDQMIIPLTPEMIEWATGIFTKITVRADSLEELESVYEAAKNSGIPCSMIEDVGKTEFHGIPTKTACAIGPDDAEKIDKITGYMKLF